MDNYASRFPYNARIWEFYANPSLEHRLIWRGFFWFLSPLGVACAVLAALLLPATKPPEAFTVNVAKIDFLGSFTSSLSIVCLLIPISGGGSYYQWGSPMVISMLAVGTSSFLVFILVEWKVARLPIIPSKYCYKISNPIADWKC